MAIITGICEVCGKFQKDKKFEISDKRDNAAWNFVICDTCNKKANKASMIILFVASFVSILII
jgi:hypothetical protein